MDTCEDVRHTLGMKAIYDLRKETIERVFVVAKENHCMRYTQLSHPKGWLFGNTAFDTIEVGTNNVYE